MDTQSDSSFFSQNTNIWEIISNPQFKVKVEPEDYEDGITLLTNVIVKQEICGPPPQDDLIRKVTEIGSTYIDRTSQDTLIHKVPEVDSTYVGSTSQDDPIRKVAGIGNICVDRTAEDDLIRTAPEVNNTDVDRTPEDHLIRKVAEIGSAHSDSTLQDVNSTILFEPPVDSPVSCDAGKVRVKQDKPKKRTEAGNKRKKKRKAPVDNTCDLCNKTFTRRRYLDRHMRSHTGERPFQCNICFQAFYRPCTLKKHIRIHTGEKPYKCTLCAATFSRRESLVVHMSSKTHFDVDEYEDSLTHGSNGSRKRITKKVIPREKNFTCEQCGLAFGRRGDLTRHQKIHFGIKSHRCEWCNAAFLRASDLTNHLRTHTGEKPFKCDLCNRAFAHSTNLRKHTRLHEEGANIKCDICGATVGSKRCLKLHKESDELFQCNLCDSSYETRVAIRKHLKVHQRKSAKKSISKSKRGRKKKVYTRKERKASAGSLSGISDV